MKAKNIFRGLTATFASVLSICYFLSVLAFERTGDINSFLKIEIPTIDGAEETTYFKSDYATVDDFKKAQQEHIEEVQRQGSILLKNDNNALPLLSSERKVTIFGRTGAHLNYRGGSGGVRNDAASIDLKTALTNQGFQINEAVYNKLASYSESVDNGNIAEPDVSIYDGLSFDGYKDAAIVVLGRYGGEANDMDVVDKDGVRELSLHKEEQDMLNLVKNSGFEKIIVLVNSGYAMELSWLDEYDVDACLFIGFPGQYGMNGVVDLLVGNADPSGHTVDTFATNSLSSPAMQNFGDFVFENLSSQPQYKKEYLVYAEGIYTGYKYYETRYQDQVLGINNATGNYGVFASENSSWDYSDEMGYTFGYGLSYADFTQTLKSLTWDKETHEVTAVVNVKNEGDEVYQGKSQSVVQLYVQLPYTEGEVEKSAIQLIGYGKTIPLSTQEDYDVTITVSDYLFATYDNTAVNGSDTSKKGCYIFDEGDYYFSIGNDAHDALNNVLSVTHPEATLFDADRNIVEGDPDLVSTQNLAEYDNVTYSKSETGEVVSNQFDDRDINYFYDEDVVTYLTRSDWSTFPKSYTNLTAADEIASVMTQSADSYKKASDAPSVDTTKYDQEKVYDLVEFREKDFNDPEWETLLNQLSIGDLSQIIGEHLGNSSISNVNYPENVSNDGPDGLNATNSYVLNAQFMAAATFNLDLITERGEIMGEQALWASSYGMAYAPGGNLHRTPYGGRNYEYYSEDSIVSYYCGWYQTKAMTEKGLLAAIKHFTGNDQETNRHGVATFMNEQTYRQNNLKAFEGAFTKGETLATMTAFNRIGVKPTSSDYETMTQVLRNEWGFKGINITDSSKDATTYMFTGECIMAGTTIFNNDVARSTDARNLIVKNNDGAIFNKLRESAKYFLYAYSRCNILNGYAKGVEAPNFTPWWKTAIYAVDGTLIGLTVISLGMFVYTAYFSKRKNKEEQQ